jgi:long-chain acyl-CoA synthetase
MAEDEKPWLKSYKLGPYKLEATLAPYPELPLSSLLDQSAARFPTQTAILFRGRELKLHQLKRLVDRLAAALTGMGLEKGDRVCLFLPNCPEYIIGYWAVLRAGGVVVPTSILRSQEGLLHEVGLSGARMAVCRLAELERVIALREACALERVLVTSDEGYDVEAISGSLPDDAVELRAMLAGDEASPPAIPIDSRNDLCELAFTGGATGVPKGVMLTHSNRLAAYLQGLPWFMKPLLGGVTGKASTVGCIPLFHAYGGFVQQSAIGLGLRVLLLPDPRDTRALVECVLEHRPLLVPGVPTQFMRLAEAGLKRSNTMLFSGSAPLPQEVVQAVRSKTGMSISEGYGLTETSTVSHVNLSAFARITGFVAKEKPGIGVPVPDTECRLLDPSSGEPAPEGGPGELVLRGPQVMKGYWPAAGSGLTPDGWLHTGDIVTMDDDGYFHVIDRIKDMVNVSGMKVYTNEVDEVLFRHPAIQMAAAFGVPDTESPGSERVMAVVQLKDGLRGQVGEEEIREFCRNHLPPYAVPKHVEFRDELPLTVTEKVFKKALRDEVIARTSGGGGR